jgi:outer membrane protein OmpA-like peptidoglycan-associated protein
MCWGDEVPRIRRTLAMVALAALAGLSAHGPAGSAGKRAKAATPIQCACCTSMPDAFPPMRCRDLCDKSGMFTRVHFGPRSSELTERSKRTLVKQAACMIANHWRAEITGNADLREGGSKRAAWAIARRRVDAVKRFLMRNRVPENRIQTSNYGDYRPITEDRTPQSRSRNRRVDTIIFWQ